MQIPFGNFLPDGSPFDRLRIQVAAAGSQTITAAIDNIKYQIGVPSTDTTDFAVLNRHNLWTKAQGTGITTLTDGATISWDASVGNTFQVTLGGNRIMAAPTGIKPGYTYLLHVIQDGSGSRTITWNAVFKWAGGTAPTLSTGIGEKDLLSFTADASGNLVGTAAVQAYA